MSEKEKRGVKTRREKEKRDEKERGMECVRKKREELKAAKEGVKER